MTIGDNFIFEDFKLQEQEQMEKFKEWLKSHNAYDRVIDGDFTNGRIFWNTGKRVDTYHFQEWDMVELVTQNGETILNMQSLIDETGRFFEVKDDRLYIGRILDNRIKMHYSNSKKFVVSTDIIFNIDVTKYKRGLVHFVEHILGNILSKYIQKNKLNIRYGFSTSFNCLKLEFSADYIKKFSYNLDTSFEANLVLNIMDLIRKALLDNNSVKLTEIIEIERSAIKNEISYYLENQISTDMQNLLEYSLGEGYNVLGSVEDVDSITYDEIIELLYKLFQEIDTSVCYSVTDYYVFPKKLRNSLNIHLYNFAYLTRLYKSRIESVVDYIKGLRKNKIELLPICSVKDMSEVEKEQLRNQEFDNVFIPSVLMKFAVPDTYDLNKVIDPDYYVKTILIRLALEELVLSGDGVLIEYLRDKKKLIYTMEGTTACSNLKHKYGNLIFMFPSSNSEETVKELKYLFYEKGLKTLILEKLKEVDKNSWTEEDAVSENLMIKVNRIRIEIYQKLVSNIIEATRITDALIGEPILDNPIFDSRFDLNLQEVFLRTISWEDVEKYLDEVMDSAIVFNVNTSSQGETYEEDGHIQE